MRKPTTVCGLTRRAEVLDLRSEVLNIRSEVDINSFILNGLLRLRFAACDAGSKLPDNPHNPHNLLNLLVFWRLRVMEVIGVFEHILHHVYGGEPLN